MDTNVLHKFPNYTAVIFLDELKLLHSALTLRPHYTVQENAFLRSTRMLDFLRKSLNRDASFLLLNI